MHKILLPLLAATIAAPAVAAQAEPAHHHSDAQAEQARIPFAGLRIRNFRADGQDVVYIEDQRRNWYRAELFGPCSGLPFANAIGIDTRGTSSFDRFSAIVVRGERCQLKSLTRSAEPPKRKAEKSRG
jgi:hypothetical protein